MTIGLRCCQPACRPHPASLPVRVPTVESLLSASFSFTSRLRLAVSLRLPSSAPVGSFHPTRFCPCWAHWRKHSCLPRRHSPETIPYVVDSKCGARTLACRVHTRVDTSGFPPPKRRSPRDRPP